MHSDFSDGEINEYLTRQYIDKIFNDTSRPIKRLSETVDDFSMAPKIGDHLVTPRKVYTHHGIYAGNDQVIHYSGLSDGLNSGPIEKVSMLNFCVGNGFQIREHLYSSYKGEQAIERARSRLSEEKYSLPFNNCEHFVYWCLYNKNKSLQVDGVKSIVAHSPIIRSANAIVDAGESIISYINGDISKDRMLEEVSEIACNFSSVAYFSSLGQATIPVPGVGALLGAGVGYIVGGVINQSGLIAIGDSRIVRQAKQRRQEIADLCNQLTPQIRKSRNDLEQYLNLYFRERKDTFLKSFDELNRAICMWDSNALSNALQDINFEFGKALKYSNFDDFSSAMHSEQPLKFS